MKNPNTYYLDWKGLVDFFGREYFKPTGDYFKDTSVIAGMMLIFAVGSLLLSFCSSILNSHIGAYFGRNLRHAVFEKVMSLPEDNFDEIGIASLITRTTNDIEQMQRTVQFAIRMFVRAPVNFAVAIAMILYKNSQVAIIIALIIPIMIFVMVVTFIIAVPLFEKIQVLADELTLIARENIKGVRIIRAFNKQEKELERFNKTSNESKNTSIRFARIWSFNWPITDFLFMLNYLGIYFFGYRMLEGALVTNDTLYHITNIMACAEYSMELMFSFIMLSWVIVELPRARVCAKRINAILDCESEKDSTRVSNFDSSKDVFDYDNLSFKYPRSEKYALTNINIKAKPGDKIAICGTTGSGKSTLVSLLTKLYQIDEGSISIMGQNINDATFKDVRSNISFAPQQSTLFNGDVYSNLLKANPNASEEDMRKALSLAECFFLKEKGEDILKVKIEQNGKNLSGGQKQRLCIARALLKDSSIYIFDDSFSALDFKTDYKIRKNLYKQLNDKTIIIVAQRISTIMHSDNIVVLDEGKIVGQGKHDFLLMTCPKYKEIVKSQFSDVDILSSMKGGITNEK